MQLRTRSLKFWKHFLFPLILKLIYRYTYIHTYIHTYIYIHGQILVKIFAQDKQLQVTICVDDKVWKKKKKKKKRLYIKK